MKVAEVQISPSQARSNWLEYQRAVKERHNKEDDILRKAYRFLSQGRRVLALHQVMAGAGRDDKYRPKLAIARCHWTHCWFRYYTQDIAFFTGDGSAHWREHQTGRSHFKLNAALLGAPLAPELRREMNLRAPVPSIPPEFRPAGDLSKYAILWEAEWQQVPHDPILLKPLGGDLYLVCAQWDLTSLERSILFAKV